VAAFGILGAAGRRDVSGEVEGVVAGPSPEHARAPTPLGGGWAASSIRPAERQPVGEASERMRAAVRSTGVFTIMLVLRADERQR